MIEFHKSQQAMPNGITLVRLSGHLDAESATYFFGCMEELILAGEKRLIIDCHGLRTISSMGLAMLLRAHSRLRKADGDVKLAEVHAAVLDVLSLVRVDRILDIYPSVLDAQAAFPPLADL